MLDKQIAWLPAHLEVLTDIGWVQISELYVEWSGIKLLTFNPTTKVREWKPVKSMAKRPDFSGNITRITTDTQVVDYYTAFVLDKHDVFPSFDPVPNVNHVKKALPYKGSLFNVDVQNSVIFCRSATYPNNVSRDLIMVDKGTVDVYKELAETGRVLKSRVPGMTNKMRRVKQNRGRYVSITLLDYWVCQTKW